MKGLYDQSFEHDACGVGLVADLNNVASHEVIVSGLSVLKNLIHRGATGNDPETGDGAGLLFKLPDAFFRKEIPGLPPLGQYAVAMVFEKKDEKALIESVLNENGYRVLCWRDVPVKPEAIGTVARSGMPAIKQLFITFDPVGDGKELERKLFVLRRVLEKKCQSSFFCSLSSRTIVYKGLFIATQLEKFYPDLTDEELKTSLVLVHQRFSTNTFPSWELAHPFRLLAHNGEINTIKGNLNAMRSRLPSLSSPLLGDDLQKVLPLFSEGASDSFCLDNIFELLINSGYDPAHAILMLMPQAWGAKYHMGHDIRAFYEYHSALMEPWDGPSALAFTDGVTAGAALDRNGLRPARWTLRKDGLFVLASETGVLDIPPKDVARRGHLNPGSIILLDLEEHRILENEEVKTKYARLRP
ncbi:glutamate synthase subunit alpha, partial [bacterium]|nr:glutamate synthase subunit alpha [bacterium]